MTEKYHPKITVEFFYCGHVTGRKLVNVIVVNPLYIRPLFLAGLTVFLAEL